MCEAAFSWGLEWPAFSGGTLLSKRGHRLERTIECGSSHSVEICVTLSNYLDTLGRHKECSFAHTHLVVTCCGDTASLTIPHNGEFHPSLCWEYLTPLALFLDICSIRDCVFTEMSNFHAHGSWLRSRGYSFIGKGLLCSIEAQKSGLYQASTAHLQLPGQNFQTWVVPWSDHILLFTPTRSDESCKKWGS